MTREESKMMQGIGILVMIFFHLFEPHMNPLFKDTVLGNMGRALNPVPLYCLLSGYGMYIVYKRGRDRHRWTRCLKLYVTYWIITAVFVTVSILFMHQTRCSITIPELLFNLTDWKASYYLPAWFILPYCLLSVSALWLFKVTDKLNAIWVLIVAYGIYVISSRLNAFAWFQLNIFQAFYLFFPFVLGSILSRCNLVEKTDAWLSRFPIVATVVLIISVLAFRYFVYTGAVISFFWAAVVILSVHLLRRAGGGKTLLFFGRHNLNMWMINGWFCWYLFRPQINVLGNPILMFIVVVGLCAVLSMAFNILIQPLNKVLFNEK